MGFLGFRWLVNFGLLALPIGVTLGILLGLDASRQASGGAPLFTGDPTTPGSTPNNNGITAMVSCDKAMGLHPLSKGQEYTPARTETHDAQPSLIPAGTLSSELSQPSLMLDGNTGSRVLFAPSPSESRASFLCHVYTLLQWQKETAIAANPGHHQVTTFNNQTYATDFSAPEFWVTWRYPRGPETQPVHAFPNIKVDGTVLPLEISKISKIAVDVEWSYAVGNYTTDGDSATTTDETALTENDTNTNVAIDMFLDDDKTSAQNSTLAAYEVMVWLATFGSATQPIGYKSGSGALTTKAINGTTFTLYGGQNSLKQYVLTWVAPTTEHFVGDLTELVTTLTDLPASVTALATDVKFPTTATYLGYMGLGSEALSATKVVTFRVPTLSIDIASS
ncbi:hypothetical protein CBS470a_003450 [Colletotrichum nupharicola]|nr:hypothetical protein CBS470a_003450 [Colletotrichum nupharicola]